MKIEVTLVYAYPGDFTAAGEIAGEPVTTHRYERASEALHAFGVLLDAEHEREGERQAERSHYG